MMNKENLKRLADYLSTGSLKAQFCMSSYSENKRHDSRESDCGSVGCAVGHGPFVGPDMKKFPTETWNGYCSRVFGVDTSTTLWNWLFGAYWAEVDNTPRGAAARIKYWLDGEYIPGDFEGAWDDVESCDDERSPNEILMRYIRTYSSYL
jgi:hypothetical protein